VESAVAVNTVTTTRTNPELVIPGAGGRGYMPLESRTNVHMGTLWFAPRPCLPEAPVSGKMSFRDTIEDRWFGYVAFERHPSFNMGQNRFEGTLANLQTQHHTKVEEGAWPTP